MTYFDALDEHQQEAVVYEGNPLLVLDGSGCGKTTVFARLHTCLAH